VILRWCLGSCILVALSNTGVAQPAPRLGDVVRITGGDLATVSGTPIERVGVLACTAEACHPIPFQVDERDAEGRWVLDHGPEPTHDDPPGVIDDNDVLLFNANDAGESAARRNLPTETLAEIRIYDPVSGATRWAYLTRSGERAPRAEASDVQYDPSADRVMGNRVSLGFGQGVPDYLAVEGGPNLLDRLKVRASATFLFGLIHFTRSEADLRTQFMGWHAGPIRVIRAQRQWVRLGWGIHSPTFGSYTYFYRDRAELPVGLRLNFRPTYFFGDIVVRVILDFRGLDGWSLLVPSLGESIPLDGQATPTKAAVNQLTDSWFALRGPQITLLQTMEVSPSLATVRRRLLFHETVAANPPEALRGEQPGIGWQLDQWEDVGAGTHELSAVSYALPGDVDVRQFMKARATPMEVTVEPFAGD